MRKVIQCILWAMGFLGAVMFVGFGTYFVITAPLAGVIILLGGAGLYILGRPYEETIEIKYFTLGIDRIEKIAVGDWIDLRSAERVELKAGEYHKIRLGVGMILPDGYEAHVLPRSSTPAIFGIMCANSMGVIDNSYSGDADEWQFPAVAIRDTVIEQNERICQFRIVKNQPTIRFKRVAFLNPISRGGIGSTGKR